MIWSLRDAQLDGPGAGLPNPVAIAVAVIDAKAMGMTGISKSQVSRLCAEIDDKIAAFLNRPLEGDWPYLWLEHEGLKAAVAKVLHASWQRCRVDPL
jgi:transposase-like protein